MRQAPVLMYCTRFCPYCVMAERLLEAKGVAVEKIRVDTDPERRAEMERISGGRTVPQVIIGDTAVGGFTDLAGLERAGELDRLLLRAQPPGEARSGQG